MDRFRDLGITLFDLIPNCYKDTDNGELEDLCSVLEEDFNVRDTVLDKMEASRRADTCPESFLPMLAWDSGLVLPSVAPIDRQRRLIGSVIDYYKGKGNLQIIHNAILLLTGLYTQVFSYWADPDQWVIGVSEIQTNSMCGLVYRKSRIDTFRAGYGESGSAISGDRSINQHYAYTFQVRMYRQPLPQEFLLIRWVCNWLKRAEDHFEIYWPPVTLYWTIGTSRIEVDATVAPNYWEVGVDMIGIGTMCGGVVTPPAAWGGVGAGSLPSYPISGPSPASWFLTP